MTKSKRGVLGCVAAMAALVGGGASANPGAEGASWTSGGLDAKNSRYQAGERKISPQTVGNLRLLWSLQTSGEVTATPAVEGDFVYFPDSAGYLYKVNKTTGQVVWKHPVSTYTGIAGDSARATPAIAGNALILGNLSGKFLQAFGQPAPQAARVFAVNKHTGAPMWVTQIDDTVMSFVTHSAIIADGMAIVGTASNEELVSAFVPKPYWKFLFRGSVSALDVATGQIKWKTYMAPPVPAAFESGYSGNAVWGGGGAYDPAHKLVYMATGNNYSVPESVRQCLASGGGEPCVSPDNHNNSIVAMDVTTGAVKWAQRALRYDAWSVACGLKVPGFELPSPFIPTPGIYANCPGGSASTAGPDYDFAQGPMLFGGNGGDSQGGNLVGAGQKSGQFWAYNAKTGKLAWTRQVAPGGVSGGLQWGSSTDGKRVFVAVSNAGPTTNGGGVAPLPWTLKDGSVTLSGGWAALDASKGDLLWTTKDPQGRRAEGAVTGANGVIFGCNQDTRSPDATQQQSTYWALDAQSGAPLWSFEPGAGPCTAGASVVDGMVFWGKGNFRSAAPSTFHAFGL
jgi:polyvinyl alcohol dehydrogenase (cytochrome)